MLPVTTVRPTQPLTGLVDLPVRVTTGHVVPILFFLTALFLLLILELSWGKRLICVKNVIEKTLHPERNREDTSNE